MSDQRDRFVAFAFAASDVLLEIDDGGTITFAAGSMKSLLGHAEEELLGTSLPDLAADEDRVLLKEYVNKLIRMKRAGDQLVKFRTPGGPVTITLSGMTSPQRAAVHHLALKKVPLATRRADADVPEQPMAKLDFANASAALGRQACDANEALTFSMFDVALNEVEEALGIQEAKELSQELVQTMRAWASGGSGVGEIDKGKYSVLLDESVDPEMLADRLRGVTQEHAPEVDAQVHHASLRLDDVVDTDQFEDFFERAMERFDELGGGEFDLTGFNDLPPPSKSRSSVELPAHLKPTTTRARRRGVTEDWG